MQGHQALDIEIELIRASLLPEERLDVIPDPSDAILLRYRLSSDNSDYVLAVTVRPGYPDLRSLDVEVRSPKASKEDDEGWKPWVTARVSECRADEE